MSQAEEMQEHRERAGMIFEVVLRLGTIFALLFWGVLIVAPFLHPLVWAVIMAVALYPAFQKISTALGKRPKLAGGLFIAAAIALVIVPAGFLAAESMDGVKEMAERWQEGDLRVPPPSPRVQELPVVGDKLFEWWTEASKNLEDTVKRFAPQLQALGGALLSLAASAGGVLLLMAFSLIIAAILMAQGPACIGFAHSLARRIVGDEGDEFLTLATNTIRGVAMGVIGTATIQAAAAAAAFVVMGMPLAGLWAALVLVLAITQLPPLLVLLPIAVWSFSAYDTAPATLFAIWLALVAMSDNLLKPMLMGRGNNVPMMILLIGSLGGMILSGIMGLFVGAVVLAVIYKLFGAWLNAHESGGSAEEAAATPAP